MIGDARWMAVLIRRLPSRSSRAAGLSEAELAAVYAGNAQRLLGVR